MGNQSNKIFKLMLFQKGKEKFDDAISIFYVIAKTKEEAISKGEQAFAKGCLIEKNCVVKYYEPLTQYCECEIDGVFLENNLIKC